MTDPLPHSLAATRQLFCPNNRRRELDTHIAWCDERIAAYAKDNADVKKAATLMGIGPVGASAAVGTVGDFKQFAHAAQFGAWIALTLRQHSSGGNCCFATGFYLAQDAQRSEFWMCGVDLTRIDGVDVTTAQAVVSEVGTDLSRFPTIKHFTSWLGLCPGTKITGGKVMSGKTRRVVNCAAQALRLAAAALRCSKSALGAYIRRMCSGMDKPKAVTAAAHKLALLIYTELTQGQEYTDQGQDYDEERYRERVLRALSQRAAKFGMQMVPIAQTV